MSQTLLKVLYVLACDVMLLCLLTREGTEAHEVKGLAQSHMAVAWGSGARIQVQASAPQPVRLSLMLYSLIFSSRRKLLLKKGY